VLVNGVAQIEETALPIPQFTLLHSVTCVQLRLITILGNCGCVAVASFLGVPSPLDFPSSFPFKFPHQKCVCTRVSQITGVTPHLLSFHFVNNTSKI
jgi:hypothetical protein